MAILKQKESTAMRENWLLSKSFTENAGRK